MLLIDIYLTCFDKVLDKVFTIIKGRIGIRIIPAIETFTFKLDDLVSIGSIAIYGSIASIVLDVKKQISIISTLTFLGNNIVSNCIRF
ncbi:hypothetical protein SAMN04487957_1031 [Halomonas shengliensis]|uniref:Uncharacterized protein n=1 Tax=Halomonas shengliensis TaxID=419597 RepID=A0A1H0FZF7_9GAMM|nr:hypothetical protein SAMN04487957_1031 [Halomonas shengliensis]